jgi:type III secretion system low calcium response chaperone LcrH/SycD
MISSTRPDPGCDAADPGQTSDKPVPELAPGTSQDVADGQDDYLYAVGYQLYQQKKYAEATCFFVHLCLQNLFSGRYVYALGACMQAQSALEPACEIYEVCRLLEPENPLAAFHLGECYLKLGKPDLALQSYRAAARLAQGIPELASLMLRSGGMADLLSAGANAQSASVTE